MLILFDIDATLITTLRTGMLAMGDAGRALFGPRFSENNVDYAGRLDPLIIHDLLVEHGCDATAPAMEEFREAYGKALRPLLARPGTAKALPGVMALLDRLQRERGVTMGLLTGNYPETGAMKLRASGIEPDRFQIQVWGSESPHAPPARDHLPAVALRKWRDHVGREVSGEEAVIIGDTPHDVRCALVNGCRALGVATGQFSVEKLSESGAHRAVADLSATDDLTAWLMRSG